MTTKMEDDRAAKRKRILDLVDDYSPRIFDIDRHTNLHADLGLYGDDIYEMRRIIEKEFGACVISMYGTANFPDESYNLIDRFIDRFRAPRWKGETVEGIWEALGILENLESRRCG